MLENLMCCCCTLFNKSQFFTHLYSSDIVIRDLHDRSLIIAFINTDKI